jgi:hypothetical protein
LVGVVRILFQAPPDVFQDLVNNRYDEFRMISVQVIREHRHQPDISVVEFPRLREHFVQGEPNACIIPIELPNEFEDLVNRALGKDVVDEMPNEKFRNRSLLRFARSTLWWIALTQTSQ